MELQRRRRCVLPSPSVPASHHEDKSGLSLSEVAFRTGIPVETTRRALLKLSNSGLVQRRQERYDIALPDELLKAATRQALALNHIIRAIPGIVLPADNLADGASEAGKGVGPYWTSVLRYCGNLRRRITKGVYLSTLVAGVLQIETLVRHSMLLNGKSVLSRPLDNQAIQAPAKLEIPLRPNAYLTNKPMPQSCCRAPFRRSRPRDHSGAWRYSRQSRRSAHT